MASEWLQEAREVKSEARKSKSAQVFLQPIYKGKKLTLEYRNLKLRIGGMTKKRVKFLRGSNVPRFLKNDNYANWGGYTPKVLFVHGVILTSRRNKKKKYFVAMEAHGENGIQYYNQIATLHLLFARDFFTPIAECSWLNTEDVNPKNLRKRLEAKADLKIETQNGRAFLPHSPIGLKVYDCMGWVVANKKKSSKRKST
ncbi:MAG: hypothetical protein ABWX90_02520 [Candidatus Saccharimonadales bacterium]